MPTLDDQAQAHLDPAATRGSGMLDVVRAVLARLPAEQREIVVLLGYYRLTRDEISALVNQPVARVDALFRAAVRSLKSILGASQQLGFA
ncbi:MAG TPA: sigma factor-like helix-turn-helix DNA-binding protein [Planctomycetota bacterium]|nr:sigma factor-like helix-turn-helix DNA-binding protein [Planctomycetota bacterium]